MNKRFIVANLKSNQTQNEVKSWVEQFLKHKDTLDSLEDKEIIICPSFPFLFSFHSAFSGTNIKVGAQNVSPFDKGAYTGEVNAKQIKDFADYVIVGHSERRSNFKEDTEMLSNKIKLSLENNLDPIFCVQNKETPIPDGVNIIAYEPIFAIGSGNPDTPENADAVGAFFKSKKDSYQILYGGSVTSQNVKSFTQKENIDGVLVGGASLEVEELIKIIQNA